METSFRLPRKLNSQTAYNLILEIGEEGISFLFTNRETNVIDGLIQYHFKRYETGEQQAEQLEKIFDKEYDLLEDVKHCKVFYNYRDSKVVPAEYYDTSLSEAQFNLVHGRDAQAEYGEDSVENKGMVVMYRVNKYVADVLRKYFPNAVYFHSTACTLKNIIFSGNIIQCIIYSNHFKVFVVKNGQLQLVQYFSYNAPMDVVYYLVNICQTMELDPTEIELELSGLVDDKSILYREIYKFFPSILLKSNKEDIMVSDGILDQPVHFFSNLTQLSVCG